MYSRIFDEIVNTNKIKELNLTNKRHNEFLEILKGANRVIQVQFNSLNYKDLSLYCKLANVNNTHKINECDNIILLGGIGMAGSAYRLAKKHSKNVFVVLAQDTFSDYDCIRDCFDANDFIKVTSFINLLAAQYNKEYSDIMAALDSYYMNNIKTDVAFNNNGRYINEYYAGRAIHKLIQAVDEEQLSKLLDGDFAEIPLNTYYSEVEKYGAVDTNFPYSANFTDDIDMIEWARLQSDVMFKFNISPYPHINVISSQNMFTNKQLCADIIYNIIDNLNNRGLSFNAMQMDVRGYMMEIRLEQVK